MLIDSLIQIFSTSRSVDTKTKASKTLFLGCKENYSSSATHLVIFRFFICIICCRLIKHKCLLGLYTAFDAVVKIVLPVRMFSYKLRIVLQQRKTFLQLSTLVCVWGNYSLSSLQPSPRETETWSCVFTWLCRKQSSRRPVWPHLAKFTLAKFWPFFLIWQSVEPALENLVHYWASFNCCLWPNFEK